MKEVDSNDVGKVEFNHNLLKEVVFNAVKDIKGVSLTKGGIGAKLFRFLFQIKYPGIKVRNLSSDNVSIQIRLYVKYGQNIPETARRVQDAAQAALNKAIEIEIKQINVNIRGIIREDVS